MSEEKEKPVPEKPVQDQSSENKQMFVEEQSEAPNVRFE